MSERLTRMAARRLAAMLSLFAALGTTSASATTTPSHPLDALARDAAALPDTTPRFVQNYKQGLRAATYSNVMVSPSNPDVFYVASLDGYVFGTQNRGVTWSEGRLIVKRSRFYGSIRPAPVASGAPFHFRLSRAAVGGLPCLLFMRSCCGCRRVPVYSLF